jgi:signal transduction histidine kinase
MSNVVNRIQRLISRLSAAPETTEFQPHLHPGDLAQIVLSAIDTSGIRNLTRINVVEEIEPIQELMLDHESIKRVILNLLLNAVEAIEHEGKIEIKVNQTSDGYAQVSVSDTGCGISQEFIRNGLFQPFKTTKNKGLGLGLYQCKSIIDACGGSMNVRSSQGIGSTFIVKLPIQKTENARTEPLSGEHQNWRGGRESDAEAEDPCS